MRFSVPNLTVIFGQFGSGKSLYSLQIALYIANLYHKPLVTNFKLDPQGIRQYCINNNYRWFLGNGRCIFVDLTKRPLIDILRPDSVCIFDESGAGLNARNWSRVPDDFNRDLVQLRHLNIHLICVCQFPEQIDKNIRELSQLWVWCRGLAQYDFGLRKPRLYFRFSYHYEPKDMLRFFNDNDFRLSEFRLWRAAKLVYWRFLPIYVLIAEINNLISAIKVYISAFVLLAKNRGDFDFLNYLERRFNICRWRVSIESLLFNCFDTTHDFKRGLPVEKKFKFKVIDYQGQLPDTKSNNDDWLRGLM